MSRSRADDPSTTRCPIDFASSLFGDRWSLLILRDVLIAGKCHHNDFLRSNEGIATNILGYRLKKLVAVGILERRADPQDGRRCIYLATERGIALIPVLLELGRWSVEQDPALAEADPGLVARYTKHPASTVRQLQRRARERRTAT